MTIYGNFYVTDLNEEQVKKIIAQEVQNSVDANGSYSMDPESYQYDLLNDQGEESSIWLHSQFETLWSLHRSTFSLFIDSLLVKTIGDSYTEKDWEVAVAKWEESYFHNGGGLVLSVGALNELKEDLEEEIENNELSSYFDITKYHVRKKLFRYVHEECDINLDNIPFADWELTRFAWAVCAKMAIRELMSRARKGQTIFYLAEIH